MITEKPITTINNSKGEKNMMKDPTDV